MQATDIQTRLAKLDMYDGKIDGDVGPKTRAGILALLNNQHLSEEAEDWSAARRQMAAMQAIMKMDGLDPGKIDGLIGPQTRYAMGMWDARKQAGDTTKALPAETARDKPAVEVPSREVIFTPATGVIKPTSVPQWPKQAQCASFFGAVGSNQTTMRFPYPMRIAWDTGKTVSSASCHVKCKPHFERIFQNTLAYYGIERIRQLRLDMYGGLLNVRKMRGGSSWSMHAWGIAIDIDPDKNQLSWGRDRASLDGKEYDPFWSFVEAEGGVSLGRKANYDWMHFQFARL